MRTVPLAEAKDELFGLVDEAETAHEIFTSTRHGPPPAVLMSADDLESLHEPLAWLSKPTRKAVAAAEREHAAGGTTSGQDLRADFGLPAR